MTIICLVTSNVFKILEVKLHATLVYCITFQWEILQLFCFVTSRHLLDTRHALHLFANRYRTLLRVSVSVVAEVIGPVECASAD